MDVSADLIARALERVKECETELRSAVRRDDVADAAAIALAYTVPLCALVRALRRFVGDEQNTPALRRKPGASDSECPR